MIVYILFIVTVIHVILTVADEKLTIYVADELDYYDARDYCLRHYNGSLLRMAELSYEEENIILRCTTVDKLFWVMREGGKDACRKKPMNSHEDLFELECLNIINYYVNAFVCVTKNLNVDLQGGRPCSTPTTTLPPPVTSHYETNVTFKDTGQGHRSSDPPAGLIAGITIIVLVVIGAVIAGVLFYLKQRGSLPNMNVKKPKLSIPKPNLKFPQFSFFKPPVQNVYEQGHNPQGNGPNSHTYAAMQLPPEYSYVEPNASSNNQEYLVPSPMVISRNVNYLVLEENRRSSVYTENKYETMDRNDGCIAQVSVDETEEHHDKIGLHETHSVYENIKSVKENVNPENIKSCDNESFIYDLAKNVSDEDGTYKEDEEEAYVPPLSQNSNHVISNVTTTDDDCYDVAKPVV